MMMEWSGSEAGYANLWGVETMVYVVYPGRPR